MKTKRLYFLLAILFVSYSASAQEVSPTEKTKPAFQSVVITIDGMACQEGCADVINANLKNTTGVTSTATSFETGKAIIEFNPKLVSIDTIKEVITETKVKDYVYSITDVSLKKILK